MESKGPVVFRGDAVSDQNGLSAFFQDLAPSAPSSIAGLNFVIGYGQFLSHKCSTADATKAYMQSNLQTEVPTWVLLPPELVPAKYRHLNKPCARLVKSLYGHPESSAHWFRHADAVLRAMGGVEFDSLKSCCYFPSAQLCLSVYVDDFTLGGHASAHKPFWDEPGARIKLEVPLPLTITLGRAHLETALDGRKALAMQATEFAQCCVERYQELSSMPVRSAKHLILMTVR